MKKMKLTKKNKRELKAISAVLILFAIVFLWIVQTIGLPIETYIDRGKIKVIDVSSYNGTVNWKKVKDQKINHAMLKIGLSLLKEQGITPEDLDLPVAFDIEEEATFQTGRSNVTAITTTFCDALKDAGYEPMVYSGASALKRFFEYHKIKSYKIWVAHYTKANRPSVPFRYDMWQYTSKASVSGANTSAGYCDLNYYLVKNVKK